MERLLVCAIRYAGCGLVDEEGVMQEVPEPVAELLRDVREWEPTSLRTKVTTLSCITWRSLANTFLGINITSFPLGAGLQHCEIWQASRVHGELQDDPASF